MSHCCGRWWKKIGKHAGGAASYDLGKSNSSVLQGGLEDSVFTKVISSARRRKMLGVCYRGCGLTRERGAEVVRSSWILDKIC